MSFFTSPRPFRLTRAEIPSDFMSMASPEAISAIGEGAVSILSKHKDKMPPHSSHPAIGHLILLVFEAVMEVVCVSLPGYIVARQGMFDAEAQKFVANLNVQLFTPCLIFTKLASQLNADKLVELAVIPLIFVVQTLVSYVCALGISKVFRFKKRPKNFVIAMGVFGNSNSLPISLVISLSQTLKGLHWDKVPGDNDDEVAARGILYLLIFQQLGQLVRWSWGYHVLLAPPEKFADEDQESRTQLENGDHANRRDSQERTALLEGVSDDDTDSDITKQKAANRKANGASSTADDSEYSSGDRTPVTRRQYPYSSSSSSSASISDLQDDRPQEVMPTPTDGNVVGKGPGNMAGRTTRQYSTNHVTSFPDPDPSRSEYDDIPSGPRGWPKRTRLCIRNAYRITKGIISSGCSRAFNALPQSVQKVLARIGAALKRFGSGLWEFMNPPLWAMLAAIIVASVPKLQHLFFDPGTFISNSVTRAVAQSGGVAVPLILVVLGANLARNTLPKDDSIEDPKVERNLLIAALVSRMLLPTIIMAPLLALTAKYVPVSILDDPIFVIVCFLLTGAPSALQLAQICQINNVYMGAMSKILFQSYVVWILPSTLVLVMLALEVVEWAQR